MGNYSKDNLVVKDMESYSKWLKADSGRTDREIDELVSIATRKMLIRHYPFLSYTALKSPRNTAKNIGVLERYGASAEDVPQESLAIDHERFNSNLETWLSYGIPVKKLTSEALKFASHENLKAYITDNFPEYVKWRTGIGLEEGDIRNLLEDGFKIYEIKSSNYMDTLVEARIAKTAVRQMRKKRFKNKRIIRELMNFGFSEAVLDCVFGKSLKSLLASIMSEEKIESSEEVIKDLEKAIWHGTLDNIHLRLSQYRIPFTKSIALRERLKEAFG